MTVTVFLFVTEELCSLCLFDCVRKADYSFLFMGGLSRHPLWVGFLVFETDEPPALLDTEEPCNQMKTNVNQRTDSKIWCSWAYIAACGGLQHCLLSATPRSTRVQLCMRFPAKLLHVARTASQSICSLSSVPGAIRFRVCPYPKQMFGLRTRTH